MSLSIEQINSLNDLYSNQKKTLEEIADLFGVTTPAIRYHLKRLDIPRRSNSEAQRLSHGTQEITESVLKKLYCKKKLTQKEIAKTLNVSQTTVVNLMRHYKIATIGKARIGKANGMFGHKHKPESIEKMRQANIRQFASQEARDNHAVLTAKQIADGKTGKSFNKLETKVAEQFAKDGINFIWQYRCEKFTFDFYLPDTNELVEVHGTFWHGDPRFYASDSLSEIQRRNIANDEKKAEYARANAYNLRIIWESDVK